MSKHTALSVAHVSSSFCPLPLLSGKPARHLFELSTIIKDTVVHRYGPLPAMLAQLTLILKLKLKPEMISVITYETGIVFFNLIICLNKDKLL